MNNTEYLNECKTPNCKCILCIYAKGILLKQYGKDEHFLSIPAHADYCKCDMCICEWCKKYSKDELREKEPVIKLKTSCPNIKCRCFLCIPNEEIYPAFMAVKDHCGLCSCKLCVCKWCLKHNRKHVDEYPHTAKYWDGPCFGECPHCYDENDVLK